MFAMVPLGQNNSRNQLGEDPTGQSELGDVYDLYQGVLQEIAPSVWETVFGGDWFSGTGIPDSFDPSRRDFHPTPLEHILYLDRVWPDHPVSDTTRTWAAEQQHLLLNNKKLTWTSSLPHRL
jgi:hypothetical protein